MTDELYTNFSIMVSELGLKESAFLVMLVSKAWNERKGGSLVNGSNNSAQVSVRAADAVPVVNKSYRHKSKRK
jgi:hypothetical protein